MSTVDIRVDFWEELHKVIKQAVKDHPSDIDRAVEESVMAVRDIDGYEDFVNDLVESAIRKKVNDHRHVMTRTTRRAAGTYHTKAKVNAASPSANGVYGTIYTTWYIGGTMLGRLKGADLPDVAKDQRAKGNGYWLNADLCEALAKMVPADKTVEEAVPIAKTAALVKKLQEKYGVS